MPETIDLGNGESAEIRTELTGADQRWFYIAREKLERSNGSAQPARLEPDPANSAQMRQVPAVPAELTWDDNFTLLDMCAIRFLVSCTVPGVLPWRLSVKGQNGEPDQPGTRDGLDIDIITDIDKVLNAQVRRLQGLGPKRQRNGGSSVTTSGEEDPAPTE